MYSYVCVYIYIYIHIHTYTHIYIYIYIYIERERDYINRLASFLAVWLRPCPAALPAELSGDCGSFRRRVVMPDSCKKCLYDRKVQRSPRFSVRSTPLFIKAGKLPNVIV